MVPYRVRALSLDDLPALVELLRKAGEIDQDDAVPSLDELKRNLGVPGYRLEYCYVATADQGDLVGFCGAFDLDSGGKASGTGAVHPNHRRKGLGTRLVALADDACRERHSHLPEDEPVHILRTARPGVGGVEELLTAEGYRPVRRHFAMNLPLDRPMPAAEFPEGFSPRPFVRERDSRTVYHCLTEAFRDHWGFTEPIPFEVWEPRTIGDARHDPELWLVAVHDNEVAGACLGVGFSAELPQRGWVASLGVRRPWRRRGLAGALLRQSFHVFQKKGFTEVGLGVDAENRTGAVALYTRAGMSPVKDFVSYRKVLRGREDLIKD